MESSCSDSSFDRDGTILPGVEKRTKTSDFRKAFLCGRVHESDTGFADCACICRPKET